MTKYFVMQGADGAWAVYRALEDQAPVHLCFAQNEADAHLIASALSEQSGERRVGDRRTGADRRKGDRRSKPEG